MASSPRERSGRVTVLPMSPMAPVTPARSRSPPGEHGVDGEGVVHRGHAQLVPGEAEVGPVDGDLGVEPYLAGAGDRHRCWERDRPGAAADGELPGHGDALAGRLEPVNAEGDVREGAGREEVARAQVPVPR